MLHGHRLFHVILIRLYYPDWCETSSFSVLHLPIKASPHYVIFDYSHMVVILCPLCKQSMFSTLNKISILVKPFLYKARAEAALSVVHAEY